MIKLWNTVTREDVMTEVIPGVWTLDEETAERLDWTSYLSHMHELMLDRTSKNEQAVREHFDDLTFIIFCERTNLERGSHPTAEEIMAYRNLSDTKRLVEELTDTTVKMTEKSWPNYKLMICAKYGIDQREYNLAFE